MIRPLLLLLALAPLPAIACDQLEAFTQSQVRERLQTLRTDQADEYDKVIAYNELSCSDDASVRLLAEDSALATGGRALQAAVLRGILFDREALILRPYDNEALTKEQRTFAEANPAITINFTFKDRDANCIGTYYKECRTGNVVDISGTGIAITQSGAVGELSLTEDGILEGIWVPVSSDLRIPVRARLK